MDHLDGTYIIGTDDESDDNNYVAPSASGRQVTLSLGNSRLNVVSRRLAHQQRFGQELLPPQPLASTSATAAAVSAGPRNNTTDDIAARPLSQTLVRLVNAAWNEHREAHGTTTGSRTEDPQRPSPEDRAQAEALWNSISPEPPLWSWPAPADDTGFEPAFAWSRPAPAGHTGYALGHGEPLTGWEPILECLRQHPSPHLSLRDCVTDYEKLFNGEERLKRRVDGQLPITSLERLFFALWATRFHLLPKMDPDEDSEARQPNERCADFLTQLLTAQHHEIPLLVNNSFHGVVAGIPAPHFKAGDLRITLLRWYESCPKTQQYLGRHLSGPAAMELANLDLYRADIRRQLEDLFREYFADALDTVRLRIYNVVTNLKPMWRTPRGARQLPGPQDDPTAWRIRPDRILDHENVIFADSWGLRLAAPGQALTIIVSGPADRALRTVQRYFLSNRVKNVYWFWGLEGLSDSEHDITDDWYSSLTEHFVRWFPLVRLFILMPPYTRENDHYWSYRIRRGVLDNLVDHCLNATVICDPLDLKLQEYHEQWMIGHDSMIYGHPPWPTEEQDAEGIPSADGLRRRKTFMKEMFGITLWDNEADNSMDTNQQAAGQEVASPGPSGSGTAPPSLQPVRHGGIPPSAVRDDPDAALITRLREMFPNPFVLQTLMQDASRFLNMLHQLRSPVQTPTWLRVYPALSTVEAVNLWGAYKHLTYSTVHPMPDSDAETDHESEEPANGQLRNPVAGHLSVAFVAGSRSPPDASNVRHPGQGHTSVAIAAGVRSPPERPSSDTIRTRNPLTEQRRGTPRASSRGPPTSRSNTLPWLGEGRQGQDW